ncbi:MAG: TolC family protein [Pseudoflavonifractor sp.]|nr:TolC family protein [Alloprevotella sp.]MCM1116785.1 TolC family protein [Pseudoflavonifractor sp.]
MKAIIIASLLAMSASSAAAQEPWSLDSCIVYATTHNISVRQSRLQQLNGEISVTSAKDAFLPQLHGSASQSWGFGRGLTADNTYADRNTSSTNFNLGLSVPVFQGLRALRNLDYARAELASALEQTEATRDNVELRVISYYLQTLLSRELLVVARNQASLSEVELARRQALFDAGKIAELDLVEARSQLAQDRLSVVSCESDEQLALLNLSQLLELPAGHPFDVAPIDTASVAFGAAYRLTAEEIYAIANERNHSIRAALLSATAARKNIKVAQSGYIPTLSFSAGLGSSYYKTSGFVNESFGSQMRHNFAQNLGFSLSVPIFDAFSTRNNVRRARASALAADLQLESTRLDVENAINQAYAQATTSRAKEESARIAATQAEAALAAVTEKYNAGRANPTEWETAKNTATRARAEAVQARYEYLLRMRILDFYAR